MVATHGLTHLALSVRDPEVFGVREYFRDSDTIQVIGPQAAIAADDSAHAAGPGWGLHLLRQHAQETCRRNAPRCPECPLLRHCPARQSREARRYSASVLSGRLIRARTASFAGSFSYSTRYTMAHKGISTPACAATAWMARAAA